MPGFGKQYDTVEDAAAAALMWLSRQPRATQQEYMALLFQDPDTGKFFRGGSETSGQRDSVSAAFEPLGDVAGVAHNHPVKRIDDPHPTTHFSPTDQATASDLGVPSFVAALTAPKRSRDVMFDPADPPPGLGNKPKPGDSFLAQFPIEEFEQALMRDLLGRKPNDPRGLMRGDPQQQRQALASALLQLERMR